MINYKPPPVLGTNPTTVSPSIPTVGTAGELTATSIALTSNQAVLSHGPIRLFNQLVEVDQYSGNGVPTFTANTGSYYFRNDVGQTYVNISASPGGTTWTQESQLAGTQTFTGTNTFTQTIIDTNTTLSFNGSGPAEARIGGGTVSSYLGPILTIAGAICPNTAHGVVGTVVFPGGTNNVVITLTNDAVFTSATTYTVYVDRGAFSAVSTNQYFVGSKTASAFTVYNINTTTGAAVNSGAGTIPFFAWGT